jgi:transcriptional regulator with XRE-family HTH domain
MATFGERLKRLREQRRWDQQELARRSGVPYMTIWRTEANKHTYPRMDVAKKLARALGVSLDLLCGLYEDEDDEAPARLAAAG